jgi:aconitate hydratase
LLEYGGIIRDALKEILVDKDASYDEYEEINLSELEPLIALPGSSGNVVPVRDVEGREIYQSYIGSSANPGIRDFAIAAMIVDGKQVHDRVSFDISPTSRQILENMISLGILTKLVHAGSRLHQAGCGGASVWGRHRPQAASACVRCHGISQAARAPKKTRFIYVAQKPPQPLR